MGQLAIANEPWTDRSRRAGELLRLQPHAEELLTLYLALLEPQREAFERAQQEQPTARELPAYVAATVLPGILAATLRAGPEKLRTAALARFHEADLTGLVSRWLGEGELSATDRYLARAATAPVLEALPDVVVDAFGVPSEAEPQLCPACGGKPQLSYFGLSEEALVAAPRRLLCSRCSRSWVYPRMVCAACGSEDTSALPIFADTEQCANVRADACEKCRHYLLTIDLPKDPAAVPVVDELAALPLDLFVRERGFTKITPNLMGF
jgi:Protein involved in formate dehydrogenase formation